MPVEEIQLGEAINKVATNAFEYVIVYKFRLQIGLAQWVAFISMFAEHTLT